MEDIGIVLLGSGAIAMGVTRRKYVALDDIGSVIGLVPRRGRRLSGFERVRPRCGCRERGPRTTRSDARHPRPSGADGFAKCRNLSGLRTTYNARTTPPSISNAAVCTGPSGASTMIPGRPLMAAKR